MLYRDELAWIHHHGFAEFAEAAAPAVIDLLHQLHFANGLVVDVGCGSGILARELERAGFAVLGIDASSSMIAIAREVVPDGDFVVAPFERADLPPCDAIVAIGEVLNYGDIRSFIPRAARALRAGGVLIFDVAECSAYQERDEQRLGGEQWSIIVTKTRDGDRLTRRILTFRDDGVSIRRDEEVHDLELYDRGEITSLLREARFRNVRVRRSYGSRRLPRGHAVFIGVR